MGNDELVQLLVSVLDPVELTNFEFKLTLGEFQVVGDQIGVLSRLIRKSLKWEYMEQHFFWRLLSAETNVAASGMTVQVLKFCSASVQPSVDAEALGGLMCLLRGQAPTSQLVNTALNNGSPQRQPQRQPPCNFAACWKPWLWPYQSIARG